MRQRSLAVVLVVSVASAVLGPGEVRAQGSNKAAAEALFAEGRKLMNEGRHAEACPKFEASQRIDPGIGTMLNLAECYERIGKTASAWAEFREVVSAARAADSLEREQLAEQRARSLETKLSRLKLELSPENAALPGLEVRRDGTRVDPAEFGSAIPVDPGTYVIEATAPGKQKWLMSVDVAGNGTQVSVEVPPLVSAADASYAASTQRDAARDTAGSSGSSKVLPIVVGGAGVVALGVGTIFGLQASSKWSDAKAKCNAYPYECGSAGLALEEDARSAANVSTIGFIGGAVLLGVGTVLWFVSDSSETTALGVGPGNVTVKGRF